MDEEYWEDLRETAANHMIELNKVIVPLRNKLLGLENQFGAWEAKKIEAERHLVEVIKVKPAKTKKGNTSLAKAVDELSPDERQRLLRAVQTRLVKKGEKQELSYSVEVFAPEEDPWLFSRCNSLKEAEEQRRIAEAQMPGATIKIREVRYELKLE